MDVKITHTQYGGMTFFFFLSVIWKFGMSWCSSLWLWWYYDIFLIKMYTYLEQDIVTLEISQTPEPPLCFLRPQACEPV